MTRNPPNLGAARHSQYRVGGGRLFSKPLLPNEPHILNRAEQHALTEQYLLPVLPALEAFFLAIRHQVDPHLERTQPIKLGKPYPLGQCLEISLAVEKRLRRRERSGSDHNVAIGQSAFEAFLRAGGVFRRVWGDLRGQYFQNAFQVGTLYVDVSNDTVTLTKPKVEILPFDQANFIPIRDYAHFAQIALNYWKMEIFPNHVLPELAPYCPLIKVAADGRVLLGETSQYMLAMTRAKGFFPGESFLHQPPMPLALFEKIVRPLKGSGYKLSADPAHGRLQALRHCREYRAKRWHHAVDRSNNVILTTLDVNLRLAKSHFHNQIRSTTINPVPVINPSKKSSHQELSSMTTLYLDGKPYNLESLSNHAKAQLASIQFVDQELVRLEAQTAALQTARNAYLQELKTNLPQPLPETQ